MLVLTTGKNTILKAARIAYLPSRLTNHPNT
jgi:hypothetical protein